MRVTLTILFSVLLLNCSFVQAKKEQKVTNSAGTIEVYRSKSCGCCGKWLEHMQDNQFTVIDHVLDDVQATKARYGVTAELASCHTATIDGYVIEGHVPASDIKKLLQQKPNVVGLTVPGMPMGTPGMEMGGKKDAYQVLSFDKNQHTQVFTDYKAEE